MAGEAALVPPLANLEELRGSAAVVVTTAPAAAVASTLLAWFAAHQEVAVVDASADGLGIDRAASLASGPGPLRRYHHLADPALAGPAALVAALGPLGPRECHLTLLDPVSDHGAGAIEELAEQGAARLTGVAPKKPIQLPGVLAFDMTPATAERRERMERQFADLFPGLITRIQALDVGVFHGHAAVVRVRCAAPVRDAAVRALLHKSARVRLARKGELVRPSDAVDQDRALCGELSCAGEWVQAWVVADGVRIGTLAGLVIAIEAITAS